MFTGLGEYYCICEKKKENHLVALEEAVCNMLNAPPAIAQFAALHWNGKPDLATVVHCLACVMITGHRAMHVMNPIPSSGYELPCMHCQEGLFILQNRLEF